MIKIKSVFPKKSNIKEIAIQTDEVLPKISSYKHKTSHNKYKTAWLYHINHEGANQNSVSYKI